MRRLFTKIVNTVRALIADDNEVEVTDANVRYDDNVDFID